MLYTYLASYGPSLLIERRRRRPAPEPIKRRDEDIYAIAVAESSKFQFRLVLLERRADQEPIVTTAASWHSGIFVRLHPLV